MLVVRRVFLPSLSTSGQLMRHPISNLQDRTAVTATPSLSFHYAIMRLCSVEPSEPADLVCGDTWKDARTN